MDETMNSSAGGGEAAVSAPEPSVSEASTPETSAATTETSTSSSETGSSDVFLKTNEDGDTEVVFDEASESTPKAENAPQDNGLPEIPKEEPAPTAYTDQQLMQAAMFNTIDPARVTPDQQRWLTEMSRQAQAAQQAQMQQNQMLQQMQQRQAEARKQVLAGLSEQAKQLALKQTGITAEDLANAEYMEDGDETKAKYEQAYNQAYSTMQYQIAKQDLANQQAMQQYMASIQEISKFRAVEMQREPQFQQITQLMDNPQFRSRLPAHKLDAVRLAERRYQQGICNQNDLKTLRAYYDDCKKAVYQHTRGVSTTPKPTNRANAPRVEHSGTPHVESGKAFNAASLRGLSQVDRDTAIQSWFASQI